jgi:signal transduction histidine kinase
MVLWRRQRDRSSRPVPGIPGGGRLRTLRFGMVHQIGFLVLLSLIVFGVISGLIIRTKYRESLQSDLVAEGRSLAEGIARSLEGGLLQDRPEALQELLYELRHLHGVLYILALDADGKIVGHSFSGPPPRVLVQRAFEREGIQQIPYPGSPGAIDIAASTSAEGLASIHVGMDLGLVARRLENVPVIVWRIVLVSVLCAASVAIIVYWRIIRPIHVIVEAIRRIGRGRFSGRVPIHCGGELGIVAASLELMYADLRRYHEQLEAKTRELEASKEELQRQNEEIRKAQAQMIRSEKFASMGQLAASIAHEISNPLAGILTYVKLIRRKLESGQSLEEHKETYRHYLLTMERETERCGNIVKNLLDFARSSEPDLREIDVHRVLEDTLFLLKFKLMMHDVVLEKDYGEIPPVSGDFGQLKQVFLNVILNALEAMKGEDRRLQIRTTYHRESKSIFVEIQDTGEGISEENIYKVFDPFFTTKPRGTGMGLAVVYGILEKHNADINIDSEPGKGTKVTIQLNAATGDTLKEGDRRVEAR